MRVPLALSSYDRDRIRDYEDTLVNLLVERRGDRVSFIPRPGFATSTSVGTGDIRGMLRKSGFLGGEMLVVSGTELRRSPAYSSVGTIPGSARVSMDADATVARIANGTNVYKYDGTIFSTEAMPAGSYSFVSHLSGFWFAVQAATQRLYYLLPGSSAWDALDFVSAEREPDSLRAAVPVNDELLLFGDDSVEFWGLTGSADPPIARVSGKVLERGCPYPNTIARGDNTAYWLGEDSSLGPTVFRVRDGPERVSNPAIEQKIIGKASEAEGFFITIDGHELYVLNLNNAPALVYDATTDSWSEWVEAGGSSFYVRLASTIPTGVPLFSGRTGASLYTTGTAAATDAGAAFTTKVSGFLPLDKDARCDVAALQCSLKAVATSETVQVRLRTSDDLGATWTDHGLKTIGLQGRRDNRVQWRRLGLMRAPGRVFELSATSIDPVIYRSLDVN